MTWVTAHKNGKEGKFFLLQLFVQVVAVARLENISWIKYAHHKTFSP